VSSLPYNGANKNIPITIEEYTIVKSDEVFLDNSE
jgi:hypothetical protein